MTIAFVRERFSLRARRHQQDFNLTWLQHQIERKGNVLLFCYEAKKANLM